MDNTNLNNYQHGQPSQEQGGQQDNSAQQCNNVQPNSGAQQVNDNQGYDANNA